MLDKDRIRGSLIGGAIGDALGYPVEFICDYRAIQQKYGERGIIRYDRWKGESGQDEKAWISDDTQIGMPGKKPLAVGSVISLKSIEKGAWKHMSECFDRDTLWKRTA